MADVDFTLSTSQGYVFGTISMRFKFISQTTFPHAVAEHFIQEDDSSSDSWTQGICVVQRYLLTRLIIFPSLKKCCQKIIISEYNYHKETVFNYHLKLALNRHFIGILKKTLNQLFLLAISKKNIVRFMTNELARTLTLASCPHPN